MEKTSASFDMDRLHVQATAILASVNHAYIYRLHHQLHPHFYRPPLLHHLASAASCYRSPSTTMESDIEMVAIRTHTPVHPELDFMCVQSKCTNNPIIAVDQRKLDLTSQNEGLSFAIRPLTPQEGEQVYKVWSSGGRNSKIELGCTVTVTHGSDQPDPNRYMGIVRCYHRLGHDNTSVLVEFPQGLGEDPLTVPVVAPNTLIHFPLTLRLVLYMMSLLHAWGVMGVRPPDSLNEAEQGNANPHH